jgi:opacity protein-like surface antigen
MTSPYRVSAIVIAAALFLTSSPAFAQVYGTTGNASSPDATRIGILGGVEFEDDNGYGLRGDLELLPLMQIGNGNLKLLGSLGWTRYSQDAVFGDITTNVYRFIPGVRLTFPMADTVGIYGDGGVGVYHARFDQDDVVVPGVGTIGGDDDETSLLLRFAGGAYYDVSPNLRVLAEVGYLPHFGDLDELDPVTLFGGVSFAF